MLINEGGVPLFDLLLIYKGRRSTSLGYARKGVMTRNTVRATFLKIFWFRCSLLKRCSLMKHQVPISQFGNRSWSVYAGIYVLQSNAIFGFGKKIQGKKWLHWKDYRLFWVLSYRLFFYYICFPLLLSTQWWRLNTERCLCQCFPAGSSLIPGSTALW